MQQHSDSLVLQEIDEVIGTQEHLVLSILKESPNAAIGEGAGSQIVRKVPFLLNQRPNMSGSGDCRPRPIVMALTGPLPITASMASESALPIRIDKSGRGSAAKDTRPAFEVSDTRRPQGRPCCEVRPHDRIGRYACSGQGKASRSPS